MSADPRGWPRPHRVTADEYRRMADVGLFSDGQRVELIDGAIVDMPPIGSRHAFTATVLAERLTEAGAMQDRHVRNQMPLCLGANSQPQPDVVVVRGAPRRYWDAHPTPEDVLLAVEVAESTLRFDLVNKARLYGAHGIPEYWVVDVADQKVFVFRQPDKGDYLSRDTVAIGSAVTCVSLAIAIDLADFL